MKQHQLPLNCPEAAKIAQQQFDQFELLDY
jgi:hypothetical protein